mmetsp:Transcript_12413/g.18197  ORF Transcript_12413/g.18197 Transcript_12413/m.18197 type:complete len:653 (-) Transcript_12413:128-2086(-)|eukprot:CAMPEP_0194215544 /NCGR_PEP_ID=MMETSP0156-20130528/17402_1 /TAXON_ID=33649 /ORGANISM="Thalassionema nitzschioides, Strain L26-B" /LENGTH=652 /DNA_ID=CAMNT_0038944079 /DNA_START=73 /DNA_END=2031 /DNA_ORIENTATION=+
MPDDSSASVARRKEQQQQWLVRFQNKTYVVDVDFTLDGKKKTSNESSCLSLKNVINNEGSVAKIQSYLLSWLSSRTRWPHNSLKIRGWSYPFCEVVAAGSGILGGKGGFGTLLKGQSKQSGAKLTTDFGACRDLQGRRLRHVNDAMKIKKWKQQKDGENEENNDYLFKTPSGLFNWHLMVPSWADISNKATRRLRSEVERQWADLEKQKQRALHDKEERERLHRESVQQYATQASVAEALQIQTAIEEGLRCREKKKLTKVTVSPQPIAKGGSSTKSSRTTRNDRKRKAVDDEDALELSSLFLTVSGEIILIEKDEENSVTNEKDRNMNGKITIQSKSDFATFIILLPPPGTDSEYSLYYEIAWKTNNGMSQIGWAMPDHFRPCSEAGDGVGDDGCSYGVDLSRKLKFHSGTEDGYPNKSKTAIQITPGDIIGCLYQSKKTETIISYSYNGIDLGVAFSITRPISASNRNHYLVPAVSCDGGEILEILLLRSQMSHWPETAGVSSGNDIEIMDIPSFLISSSPNTNDVDVSQQTTLSSSELAAENKQMRVEDSSAASGSAGTNSGLQKNSSSHKAQTSIVKEKQMTKPINLDGVNSVEELMGLGMDSLKVELSSRQCKCGGTLEERAKRLFLLKGLSKEEYPKQARGRGFGL